MKKYTSILSIILGIIACIVLAIFLYLSSETIKTLTAFPAIVAGITALLALIVAIGQERTRIRKTREIIRNQELIKEKALTELYKKTSIECPNVDTHDQQEKNDNLGNSDSQKTSNLLDIELIKSLSKYNNFDFQISDNDDQTASAILNSQSQKISAYARSLSYSLYINLGIGIFFASISISFLYLLYISPIEFNIVRNSIGHISFLQLAFPISLQILSLFFLGLYKKTSLEIKYANNEITNIELKKAAVIMSQEFSEENKLKIAKALINTERNFILKKGESTHHIEQAKSNTSEMIELIRAIQSTTKNSPP